MPPGFQRSSLETSLKTISGGQTGADRAGLDWAIKHGIPYGGWCPKGRKADSVLNVAGPRASKEPEVAEFARISQIVHFSLNGPLAVL